MNEVEAVILKGMAKRMSDVGRATIDKSPLWVMEQLYQMAASLNIFVDENEVKD